MDGNTDVSSLLSALPLCMVSLDPTDLKPLYCNEMFEHSMGPLFKFANTEFVSAACDDKTSDAQERLREAIERVVNTDTDTTAKTRVRNVEMTTLSGPSGFPIRKHFDWFISRTEDTIILLGDQVTEDDVVQREKDDELIDFFQNAPIALHWLSGEGIVLWANKTEMNVLGYSEEEYIGQPIMQFCPDEEELVLEIFKQLGSGNAIRDVPVRFRTKDRKMVHLLIDSNVKYSKDGSFGHTRCFIRDDTGRKIREARASLLLEETKRSLKMLDNFMARSLHHLRTPLHVTQNMVDAITALIMCTKQDFSKEQKEECLNLCKITADQINSSVLLMDDIADLASFDQGKVLHTTTDIVDLESFGRDMLGKVPSANTGVEVAVEIGKLNNSEQGPTSAMTDPSILNRVLDHLLANAVDVTTSGSVVLQIGYRHKRLTFAVVDTGPGLDMPADAAEGDLPTIFQRYHQELMPEDDLDLEQANSLREKIEKGLLSHKKNGLGIGLSLCYHLVQSLGGELRCTSAKGAGTTFQFSLPITVSRNTTIPSTPALPFVRIARGGTPRPSAQQISKILGQLKVNENETEKEKERATKRRRTAGFEEPKDVIPEVTMETLAEQGVKSRLPPSVLVVEDTKACAKMLCMTLGKFNCSTKLAENGQIAVDILRDAMPGAYDLILMDLRMPVMDGLEATRIIKDELKISTPVVALTGDDNAESRAECEKIGFDGFQGKPMKRQILKEVLKQYTGYEVK